MILSRSDLAQATREVGSDAMMAECIDVDMAVGDGEQLYAYSFCHRCGKCHSHITVFNEKENAYKEGDVVVINIMKLGVSVVDVTELEHSKESK